MHVAVPAPAAPPPVVVTGTYRRIDSAAGRALGISDGTVKNHLTEILYKLEARDRTHAVLKAIGARLL